jgi:dTDP-4-amino-4,6-dideoxygalactose transaminase
MKDIEELLVTSTCTIKRAMNVLESTSMSILLLVDDNGALVRTITDGDMRRLLLFGFGLKDTLSKLPKHDPISASLHSSQDEILSLMREGQVDQIPVVNELQQPVEIFFDKDFRSQIFLSNPHMGGLEMDYVGQAFESNWVAPLGPNVDGFEQELSNYIGDSYYAAALNSGTSAIHLALRLLDVSHSDFVLCSSFTFVASANPILYQGAIPVFVDSEPETWSMSPVALEKAIKSCIKQNKKPKAIILVHLYGQSANMKKIMALSDLYNIPVIEDAAESLGSLYKDRHTGTFGKFGVFSFNGNKIITTSGGGALVSRDKELIERARYLSTQAKENFSHYEHTEVGYNYRMSNVLAGIGRGQLKVLDKRVGEKRSVFNYYKDNLVIDCIDWMPEFKGDRSNRWLSVLTINPNMTDVTPGDLIKELSRENIEARHVWKPMHLQPLFAENDYYTHGDISFCDSLYNTGVCLPSASDMNTDQQAFVIEEILKFFKKN